MTGPRVTKRKAVNLAVQPEVEPIVSPVAMASPAKRARMAIPSFKDIDVREIAFKLGRDEKTYFAELGGGQVQFNLTPEGSMKVIYGFDMDGKMEKRAFHDNMIVKGSESLAIRVKLEDAQLDFLESLENWCKQCPSVQGKEWIPLINYNDKYKTASAKLRVCLTGACTDIKIMGDEIKKGRGWQFLKDNAVGNFTAAEVKVVAKLRIYTVDDKAGISLAATELFLNPIERVERVETFADDVAW